MAGDSTGESHEEPEVLPGLLHIPLQPLAAQATRTKDPRRGLGLVQSTQSPQQPVSKTSAKAS